MLAIKLFFCFSLRGSAPAPSRVPGTVNPQKKFCARDSSCALDVIRDGKAKNIIFFRASRFVLAPKVQRESVEKKNVTAPSRVECRNESGSLLF